MDIITAGTISTLRSNLDQDLVQSEERLQDDLYLLLWLKVNKMNIPKAAAAIREAFIFYKKKNPEAVAYSTPQALIDMMPIYVDGISLKDGLGLCYVRAERIDAGRMLREFTREEITRYGLWIVMEGERLMIPQLHKKFKCEPQAAVDSARTFVAIVDCYGFSFKHLPNIKDLAISFQVFMEMAQEAVQFPTCARHAYIIGASKVFFHILRPVAPLLTRLGITLRIYGTDEKEWREDIYKLISPEELDKYRRRVELTMPKRETSNNKR